MDRSEFGFACYRMEKILKIKNDLSLPLKAIDKEDPQQSEYIALVEQLDKVIAAEARCLDAAPRA
mgnify:CR=1 FL=1